MCDVRTISQVDEILDRHKHEGGQHAFGQVAHRGRRHAQHEQDQHPRDDPVELSLLLAAYARHQRRARERARGGVGAERGAKDVGGPEGEELLIVVHFVAVL